MSWPLRILRAFLGGTFVFAGAQKFLNSNFLRQGSPDFVGTQLRGFATGTPAGPLLRLLGHAPVVTGVAIALTEIAVGLAVLAGVFMVLAAVMGLPVDQPDALPVGDLARASVLPGFGLGVLRDVAGVRHRRVGARGRAFPRPLAEPLVLRSREGG